MPFPSYDVKNIPDRGGWEQPGSEISVILHIIRRPNSIIVVFFIQTISKVLTSLPPRI